MELAQVLLVLWRRRFWVVIGVVVALLIALSTSYRIGFLPPKLKPKSLAIGTADTQLLVDTRRSSLLSSQTDLTQLVDRASVYAPLMTTLPVRQAIAACAGVPVSAIYASAPLNPDGTLFSNEPNASQRSQQILGENSGLRLNIQANANEPTITITAQAATAAQATHLANAAACGFINYLQQSETLQRIPDGTRTVVRQLGPAEGGTIGGGVNIQLTILAFLGALIGWLVLVVIASSVADNFRDIRSTGTAPAESPELG